MRTPSAILWGLAASLLLTPLAAANELVLKDGSVLKVEEVLEATPERVAFKLAGSRQQRRADEVAAIWPSGDPYLDRAIRLIRSGGEDPGKIKDVLDRVAERGKDWAKPYGVYLLGELYDRYGRTKDAIATYDKMAEEYAGHFYAPVALDRAASISDGAGALARYEKLASGKFGKSWKEQGEYGKARLLLEAGKHQDALPVFARLATGASDAGVRELAACGEAHCVLLKGDSSKAERTFKRVIGLGNKTTSAALGYAWTGLGHCLKKSKPDEALVAYLRGVLLYPSNPERAGAAAGAAEIAQQKRWGGEQRLQGLAKGRLQLDDYGGDQPLAEVMRRTLQMVSAKLVMELAPELISEAKSTAEQAELDFLAADALKAVARASNNPDMLAEYERKLEALQKKYPNHSRAQLAGLDAFIAAKDRALAIIGQANEAGDKAKHDELLAEGRKLFEEVLEPFRAGIAEQTTKIDAMLDQEMAGDVPEEAKEERRELEHQRDLSEFLLAEAYASYAKTFPEGSEEQKKVYGQALAGYDHYIINRGTDVRWLWYSYVGKNEVLMALGQYADAAMGFDELTLVEWPYQMPDDPEVQKKIKSMVQEICIRGYHGAVRALLLAGKPQEAFAKSQEIEQNPTAQGWREHPMGILLTFERAKAMAGAGQGARGARELYRIIEEAKAAPDSQKIPGLGMSREGAGAARALSELSDLTGGEIYAPEIQFYVGLGYFLRQRPELAVAGYKGVLTAATTKKERAEWVPKAVREIGNLLFTDERYLEAALAYQTVASEFPEHEWAGEAVRYALSASKKAIEQFGEDETDSSGAIVRFSRSIEKTATEVGGGDIAIKIFINDAKKLHEDQQWIAAAQAYLKVPAEQVDEKTGQKRRVNVYTNAVANAGYCYFKGYQDSKNENHLTLARENLQKAADVSAEWGDLESQALACFYLGQLEFDLGRAQECLRALQPFDGPLSGTDRYIVRARHQQAMALLELGGEDNARKAEEYFASVESRTDDDFFEKFAYSMAVELRKVGNDLFEKTNDFMHPRTFRAKAAKYARHWARAAELDQTRSVVLLYLGDVLFDGGLYEDAYKLYVAGAPDLEKTAGSELKDAQRLDLVRMNMGFCLVEMGKLQEGIDLLEQVRRVVYVRDQRGRVVDRGLFKERRMEGPFRFTYQGNQVNRKVWFTILEKDGQELKFFDPPNAQPGGDEQFDGVQGADPTAAWTSGDVRSLELQLKRAYFVVHALEKANWALWKQTGDKKLLATAVSEANNDVRYVLRGMSESAYQGIVMQSQLEPTSVELRRWTSDLLLLRIKLARESWREVLGDIKQMELLGRKVPDELKGEFEEIRREAEARSK